MRVLITTMGSTGDLQPFLALGRRLLAEGHEVLLTAQDDHAERCGEIGVPFASIGITEEAFAPVHERMPQLLAERNPVRQLRMAVGWMAEVQRPAVPALRALVRDVDLVVHAPLAIGGVAAARREGVPDVAVTHTWPMQPTRAYGPSNVDRGPFLNRLIWSLARRAVASATDPALNTVVTAAGMPPWRNVLFEARCSTLLDLVPISPAVLPLDPGHGPATTATGYWFLDEPDYTPPADLAEFMAGPPPLVIGFGSTEGNDPHVLARAVVEAVRGLDRGVVVQGDFLREAGVEPGPGVYVAGRVPHSWLFARAGGVVHHGGAGTTAAAFRAGVPQAIVAYQGDQRQWGRRLVQLGVGPEHCTHDRFDAAWLAATLRTLAQDPAMAERAASLGAAVRAADGTGEAVRALEKAQATTAGRRG